jgi:hypothetical protein
MDSLPEDCLAAIFTFLPLRSLTSTVLVCYDLLRPFIVMPRRSIVDGSVLRAANSTFVARKLTGRVVIDRCVLRPDLMLKVTSPDSFRLLSPTHLYGVDHTHRVAVS